MGLDIGVANPWRYPPGVPRFDGPRTEGRFHLPGGRRLGYAEYGDPGGPVVLWFHGTPGGRRQFPVAGRRAAEDLGLRVVLVERPGAGLSDRHGYASFADLADDMMHIASALGADRLGVVGVRGGAPGALACAADPELGDRVAAAAILGGVTPAVGPEAADSPAGRLTAILAAAGPPLGAAAAAVLRPLLPLGHVAYRGVAALMSDVDRRVFTDPQIEAMLIEDLILAARGRFQTLADDVRLARRDWGFRLSEVKAPVRWWHGVSDPVVSFDDAGRAITFLPDADLIPLPGAGQLAGFAEVGDVLEFLRAHL